MNRFAQLVILIVAVVSGGAAISEYRMSQMPGAVVGVDFMGLPWQSILSGAVSVISAYVLKKYPNGGASSLIESITPAILGTKPADGPSKDSKDEFDHLVWLVAFYTRSGDVESATAILNLSKTRKGVIDAKVKS